MIIIIINVVKEQYCIKIILVNANFLAQPHKHTAYSYCIYKVWKPLH